MRPIWNPTKKPSAFGWKYTFCQKIVGFNGFDVILIVILSIGIL